MKFLKITFLVALTLYLIMAAVLFAAQRKLVFIPPKTYLTPRAVGVDMTEIEIERDSGDFVTAWYAPPANPDGKVVMVFHGNGSAVYSNHDIFADLIEAGYGVMSVGFPGYPGSTGKPSQDAIIDAAIQQYSYVREQGHEGNNIIFYGTSLGSGVAAQLAAIHPPALLIVDAPFNSIVEMSRKKVPWLPVSLLMKDKFESDKALAGLDVPMIWIHGTADRIVPLSQGQKLYDGYNGPKSAHIIEGGQHTNLWFLGGREIVLQALAKN